MGERFSLLFESEKVPAEVNKNEAQLVRKTTAVVYDVKGFRIASGFSIQSPRDVDNKAKGRRYALTAALDPDHNSNTFDFIFSKKDRIEIWQQFFDIGSNQNLLGVPSN